MGARGGRRHRCQRRSDFQCGVDFGSQDVQRFGFWSFGFWSFWKSGASAASLWSFPFPFLKDVSHQSEKFIQPLVGQPVSCQIYSQPGSQSLSQIVGHSSAGQLVRQLVSQSVSQSSWVYLLINHSVGQPPTTEIRLSVHETNRSRFIKLNDLKVTTLSPLVFKASCDTSTTLCRTTGNRVAEFMGSRHQWFPAARVTCQHSCMRIITFPADVV